MAYNTRKVGIRGKRTARRRVRGMNENGLGRNGMTFSDPKLILWFSSLDDVFAPRFDVITL